MGKLLVPFKKFLSNKNTITILGVLLGIVVLYFGYTWRVNQSISPVKVPYANQTLVSGTKITEANISYTDIPKDMLKNMGNIVTNVAQINGKLVSYDSKIPNNGFFFSENLIAEEEMPDSIFSNIKDGYTIVSLSVDNHATYGSSIFPDDLIDLYMKTTHPDDNKLVYGRFIQTIQVLAVKDSKGNNVFTNKENPGVPAELLFAVPEDLFLLLKKAIYLGIEIEPVPRNDSYSEHAAATVISSEELRNIILDQSHAISDECTTIECIVGGLTTTE